MTTPTTLPGIAGTWHNAGYQYRLRVTHSTYAEYDGYFVGQNRWLSASNNNLSIKITFSTNVWSDNGSSSPATVNTVGNNVELYDGTNLIYKFVKPTTASWITPGPTVIQTRTTHTGTIVAAAGFTIKAPSPGSTYEKIGQRKFRIKFLDQNEPGTYRLRVQWTTLTGTISDTQDISSGSGDINLTYEGTGPNSNPVYGPITLQIDKQIVNNGQTYVANVDFKTFTYYETGPFTGSFNPSVGLPGQAVTVTVLDTNPYPDSNTEFYYIGNDGTQNVQFTNFFSNVGNSSVTSNFTSAHGAYVLYQAQYPSTQGVKALANYDTNYVAPSTTSNGGGKPDRYPLIMTNLFNRNRSLYSIGMTHKDTWDLFL